MRSGDISSGSRPVHSVSYVITWRQTCTNDAKDTHHPGTKNDGSWGVYGPVGDKYMLLMDGVRNSRGHYVHTIEHIRIIWGLMCADNAQRTHYSWANCMHHSTCTA